MTEDPKQRRGKLGQRCAGEPYDVDEDEALLVAREAIEDGLKKHFESCRQVSDETGALQADISEGLLISVLRLIAADGKYPIEKGRFWQILDRHGPFSPLDPDDSLRQGLLSEIETLFAVAENETFEDGFDSLLSVELQRLVLQHGDVTLEIVSDLIFEDRAAPDVAREALSCLGEMEHGATHEGRRRVLERSLTCSSHVARDGALTGLADQGDPRSIPALEAAAERESYRLLRADMLEAVAQLRSLAP